MIAGPCRGHVGQAHLFGDAMGGLRLGQGHVFGSADSRAGRANGHRRYSGVGIHQHGGRIGAGRIIKVAQDDDGELQALGAVHGHDAHGIVVALRRRQFVDPAGVIPLQLGPQDELVQVPRRRRAGGGASGFQDAGLLHQELSPPPHLPGAVFDQIQLLQPMLAHELADETGDRRVVATPVILVETGHSVADRGRLHAVCHVQIIPRRAGFPPVQQVNVGAGEGRRAQGGHHRHRVGRVVDGAQAVEQVLDFLGVKQQGAALDAVGYAGVLQGTLKYPQPGARADQDAHVAQPGRADAATILVVHVQPVSAVRGVGCNQAGNLRGLPAADVVGPVVRRFSEHPYTGVQTVLLHTGVGLQWNVLRLQAGGVLAHHLPEHHVDPLQNGLLGAAVFRQSEFVQLTAPFHLLDDTQVGAAKAVDGLFGVAHDEQPARSQGQRVPGLPSRRCVAGGGQVEADFSLQRVGVLELVDEDMGVASLEVAAGVVVVPQQIPRPHQQVVESRRAVGLAGISVTYRKMLVEVLQQRVQDSRADGLPE